MGSVSTQHGSKHVAVLELSAPFVLGGLTDLGTCLTLLEDSGLYGGLDGLQVVVVLDVLAILTRNQAIFIWVDLVIPLNGISHLVSPHA